MQSNNPDTRKILAGLCHGACFFSATVVAVGILISILFMSNDSVVKANAKEALNFQISVYLWAIIGFILSFVLIGIPILILLGLFSFIAPIIAIFRVLSDPDVPYRYSFIFQIL